MPRVKKPKPVRAATLADVGRVAGVSAMAASAVLNDARTSSRISPATRQRIMQAAARLAYRPNAAARALANHRMSTIGVAMVIVDGELNQYFLELFNGILESAAKHEQNTTVFALHNWHGDTARLSSICDGRIDGLILIAPTFRPADIMLPAHTPFVSIHANSLLPNVVNVESDEEHGAHAMVRHLIALGHRRIMHLAGPAGLTGTNRRILGYKRALAGARLPFDPALLVPADFDPKHGRDAMHGWLRRHAGEPLPQAVFCVNDGVATGCLSALAEAGLRVPDDISVAGFDDSLAARTTVPQITTVRQPLRAMGACAADLLLQRIAQHNGAQAPASAKNVVFPTEVVQRASVSAPPPAARLVPALR